MNSIDGNFNNINVRTINTSTLNTNNLIVNSSFSLLRTPSFMSYISDPIGNITGSGTIYQLGSNGTFVNLYNRGMQINSSGLFTCLYDGIYNFGVSLITAGYTVSGVISMHLNVYNEGILSKVYISRFDRKASSITSNFINVQIPLLKGQTLTSVIIVETEPSNTIGIFGFDQDEFGNYFFGNLI